jgi:hypothetical protein
MLTELLTIIKDHPNGFNHDQVCGSLGITPASLQSLLDILVRKGRLTQLPLDGETCPDSCQACPALQRCPGKNNLPEMIYRLKA